MRLPCYV